MPAFFLSASQSRVLQGLAVSAEPCNLVPAESDTSDGDDSPPSPRLARSLPETKRPPYLPFLSELLETTSPSGLQLLGLGWRGKCSAYCRHPSHSAARACLGSLKLVFTKNQAHKGVRPSTHANNNCVSRIIQRDKNC